MRLPASDRHPAQGAFVSQVAQQEWFRRLRESQRTFLGFQTPPLLHGRNLHIGNYSVTIAT